MIRLIHHFSFALLLCGAVQADIISGVVTGPTGLPVVGADLDVFNSATGAELPLTNDGTIANGSFSLVVPPGTYDVVIRPPAPPATNLVGRRLDGVVVSGTASLGQVVLAQGFAVQGRVVRSGGVPAVGVSIDMDSGPGLEPLVISVGGTSATGTFAAAVPAGLLRIELKPGATLPLAAPVRLTNTIVGPTNLGDIVLPPGFNVTIDVLDAAGVGVSGVDIDAIDTATGQTVYTPGDDTNAVGRASFVLPAGTFDLEACAPVALRLAPAILGNVQVTSTTNAGALTLAPGAIVTGIVRDPAGVPLEDVDLDAFEPGPSTPIVTCGDDTDGTGRYRTVLPLGTVDLLFSDVRSACPSFELIRGVVVSGDMTLDAMLESAGLGCRFCMPGTGNSSGQPAIMDATGSAAVSANALTLVARDLPVFTFGIFVTSRTRGFVAHPGGSAGNLCLGGAIGRFNLPAQIWNSGPSGTASLPLDLRFLPTPSNVVSAQPGETWHFQAWFRDVAAGASSNYTSGLSITFQ